MHALTIIETPKSSLQDHEIDEIMDPFFMRYVDYWQDGDCRLNDVLTSTHIPGLEFPENVRPYYFVDANGRMHVNDIDFYDANAPHIVDYLSQGRSEQDWLVAVRELLPVYQDRFAAAFRVRPDMYYHVLDVHF